MFISLSIYQNVGRFVGSIINIDGENRLINP